MKIWKIAACVGAGALCVATGGLAAPLAAGGLGIGGSLAAGGIGVAGGTVLVSAITGGVGSITVATTIAEGEKAKKENKKLKEMLTNANESNAVKQQIIKELNAKLDRLKDELDAEKKKNDASDEKIKSLEEQIRDIKDLLSSRV